MYCYPTFNRPNECGLLLEHLNQVGVNSKAIIWVNGGTEANIKKYEEVFEKHLPSGWITHIHAKNIGFCQAANEIFTLYPDEPFYGLITDDEYVYTPDWDKFLIEAAGQWNVAHGNNHWQSHMRCHGYSTFGGDLVRNVGYLFPQGLWHWFSDDVWEHIARACGLERFERDINIEDKHWMNPRHRTPRDDTYLLGESRAVQDQAIFMKWRAEEFPAIVRRVNKAMGV
jgi:hypothetical protein